MKLSNLFFLIFLSYLSFSQEWVQVGSTLVGENENDHFGHSSELNKDGSILAVAAAQAQYNSKYIKVYRRSGDNWTQMGDNITASESWFLNYGPREIISLSDDGLTLAFAEIQEEWRCLSREKYLFTSILNKWNKTGELIHDNLDLVRTLVIH